MYERHGGSGTRLYKIWVGMRERCERPEHDSYPYYGGRGIRVCDDWRHSFTSFRTWAESAGYRSDKSIDRIDVNGHYEPANCRWATDKQQARNRRPNFAIIHQGESDTLNGWARRLGIGYTTLVKRYHKGERGKELFRPVKENCIAQRLANRRARHETGNGKAKLTGSQVGEILASQETGVALAIKFGVSQALISMVRSGQRRG